MIFGKYINKYYLKNAPILILGLAALILVDYFQLFIPELYRMVINGMNGDPVLVNGQAAVFDMEFLLDQVCRPMIITIIVMVVGRFLWRVCFFGSAIRVVTDLRTCMFAHSKELSQEYYQVNKVGNLMSLYTNDLDTVQECFSTTIQRETKLFLGADNEETAELTVPMYDFGDWASRMKAYRKKNHITQQELAQLMGVKHFTLRSWEQKQAKPPYNVWRLHKHLFDDSIKLT